MIADEERCQALVTRRGYKVRCTRRGELRGADGLLRCVYCAAAHERERKREEVTAGAPS